MKEKIETVLSEVSERHGMGGVWYGACQAQDMKRWNYFVFNKKKSAKASNRCDLQNYYEIHIVHEDEVPEELIQEVMEAMEERRDDGIRLRCATEDITYDYTFKKNTDMVVEMANIVIFKPEKRC